VDDETPKWTARYLRYHSEGEVEFDTAAEAIGFFATGVDDAWLSPNALVSPAGEVALSGERLDDAVLEAQMGRLDAWLAANWPEAAEEQRLHVERRAEERRRNEEELALALAAFKAATGVDLAEHAEVRPTSVVLSGRQLGEVVAGILAR
jgi:hypothetical protein